MNIRKVCKDDLESIIRLAKSLPEWFTENGVSNIKKDIPFQKCLLTIDEDNITGFISYFVNQGIAHIGWMGVAPHFQGKGRGRSLIDMVIKDIKKAGVSEIHVETLGVSVEYEPYERTRRFYKKMGFSVLKSIFQDNPECEELLILKREI